MTLFLLKFMIKGILVWGGSGVLGCFNGPHDGYANSKVFLFDLIIYVHSTIFQLCGTGLPGLNQY